MNLNSRPLRAGEEALAQPFTDSDISRLEKVASESFDALLRAIPPYLTADATQTPAAKLLCESIAQEDTPKAVRLPSAS